MGYPWPFFMPGGDRSPAENFLNPPNGPNPREEGCSRIAPKTLKHNKNLGKNVYFKDFSENYEQ